MCYWYIVQGIHVDCGGCKESERKEERRKGKGVAVNGNETAAQELFFVLILSFCVISLFMTVLPLDYS